jgi:hypothetical protein
MQAHADLAATHSDPCTYIVDEEGNKNNFKEVLTSETRQQYIECLTDTLDRAGYEVRSGLLTYIGVEECRYIDFCYATNPSGAYGVAFLPTLDDEYIDESLEENLEAFKKVKQIPDNLRSAWRLREDEAVIMLGQTPPQVEYFSYSTLLFDNPQSLLSKLLPNYFLEIFSAAGDTVHFKNISVLDNNESPFSVEMALISTPDKNMDKAMRKAFIDSGIPKEILNSLPIPKITESFGTDEKSPSWFFLQRVTLFADMQERQTYKQTAPTKVLRVTPKVKQIPNLYEETNFSPRGTGTNEDHYKEVLDLLEEKLEASFGERPSRKGSVGANDLSSDTCLKLSLPCYGLNPDAAYSSYMSPPLSEDPNNYLMIYGVNHHKTGKALYTNIGVTSIEGARGVAGMMNKSFEGSAKRYLPNHPAADKLFAVKVSRYCGNEKYCIEIKRPPEGIAVNDPILFLFRDYLEPGMNGGPLNAELLKTRVLEVKPDFESEFISKLKTYRLAFEAFNRGKKGE